MSRPSRIHSIVRLALAISTTAIAQPRLFDSTRVETGILLGIPTGSLDGPFGPSTGYRFGMSTTYSDHVHAVGSIQYAPLEGDVPVHYLVASCGLEALWPADFATAALLALHYARAFEEHEPPLQIDGGESEFGIDLRASWAPRRWRKPGIALRSTASIAFTEPERSIWIWSGIDLTWEWP